MASKHASSAVYKRLRTVRPAKVYAIVDGEARALALRTGRAKWEQAIETARKLGADGLQLHDADDNILEVVSFDELADPEPLVDGVPPPKGASTEARVEYLVALALDASDRAVGRSVEQQKQVLDSALELMRVSTERVAHLERIVANMVRQQEKFLLEGGASETKSGMGMEDMLMLLTAGVQSGVVDQSKLANLFGPMLAKMAPGVLGGNGAKG